jgi:hypothetical protein
LKGAKIDCLSFVYVPATSTAHYKASFLLQPFTVLMKKTHAVKQSIFLDVYGSAEMCSLFFHSAGTNVTIISI